MTKTSKRAWPRVRQWFNPTTFLDTWFVLLERSRAALDRLLDYGWLLKKGSAFERRPSYLPLLEGLETRVLMTTVFFHTSTQSVNFNASYAVMEADLSASSGSQITVNYATANGTGTAGTDYTSTSGTLTFSPGATAETFLVPMLNFKESSNKTFTATLSSPTNATLGSPSVDTVTIVNTPLTSAVVDLNTDVVLPSNGTPINTFSTWAMNLASQVSGAAVSTYSWSFSLASDASSISGSSTYNTTFTWSSFTGAARTDTISLTETAVISGSGGSEQISQTYPFKVIATDSPANGTAPTSTTTWSSAVGPDKLNGQAAVPAGPYAAVGLVDGSAQTQFGMPAYNPNVASLGLVYNSAVADPQPVFIADYQLDPAKSVPSTITAQLTVNGSANTTVTYSTSALNAGDTMQLAMQAATLPTSTGRYNWQIVTTAYSPTVTTTFTGSFNFINGSTTPTTGTTAAGNPFGPGWSLANVEHLWPVSGGSPGAIIQNPDGTSLWFSGSSTFTSPPGDFSTLSLTGGVYTRTMPDGTKINFNSSGQETSIADSNSETTTFAYNGTNGQLTTITDMNSQASTISYNATGLATGIFEPGTLSGTLAYSASNTLTTITDANGNAWAYGYDTSKRLTTLQDPRSGATPTTFTYNSNSQVSTVNQPDGTTQTFAAAQLTGLASGSTGTGALAAAAFATYTDPNSKNWTEYFDGLGFGRPVEDVDPLGNTSLTERDANGLPWLIADPLGRLPALFRDSSGNVTTFVNADDTFSTATYNSLGEPLVVTDPHKSGDPSTSYGTTTYTYNSSGDLLTLQNALGNTTTYTYTTAGGTTVVQTITEPLAATHSGLYTTTFQYDSTGELTTMTQALTTSTNITQSWSYTHGRVQTYTDPNGHTSTYGYDSVGNLTSKVLPDGSGVVSTYTYAYDAASNLTTFVMSLTSATNATAVYTYDRMSRLTQTQDAMNNVTTYSYDSAGNLVGVTNALGYTTTYTVDSAGQVTAVTIPLTSGTSATTTYAFDAAGDVTTLTNALSKPTTFSYNSRGWLSGVTDPLGNSTSYAYDNVGDTTSVTQTDTHGATVTNSATYYFLHLLKTTTDAVSTNDVTTYAYDTDNNLTTITGFNSDVTTYTYDALDRMQTEKVHGALTTYAYDSNGNVVNITDPLSHVSTFTYDYQNRVLTNIDPNVATITYSYDLAGRLLTQTDPNNNVTTYAYNADGWLTTTTNANNYTAAYGYDAVGHLTSATDFAGRQTTYSYNRAGWQTGETWVSGSYAATYSYDNAGDMTGGSDTNATYTFTYYDDGSVNKTAVSYPGASSVGTVTLTYSYDGYGNRTNLSDSSSGSITYTYNKNSQLTAINFSGSSTTANLSFAYGTSGTAHDILTTMTMSGGTDTITAAFSYSNMRLTTIAYSDTTGNSLPTFSYTWNNDNQVTQYTGPEGTLTYTYDAAGQLTAVGDAESYSYSFDSNGNRNSTGYTTTTGNEMTHDGTGNTLTYDHNGNLTTKTDEVNNVWTYTWDYRNRLTQVVEKNSSNVTIFNEQMTYDVFDNLIGVAVGGTQQRWTVFDGQNPYMDFSGSGTLSVRYLTNPQSGQFFGRVTSGGTVGWYLTDLTGSVREIVDKNGNVLDQHITYDPLGNIISEANSANGDRFKFQSGEWDNNVKLYHFGERWNDPVNGRWISQDPLGFGAGDSNLYRYVNNQATDLTDPSGEEIQDPGWWSLVPVVGSVWASAHKFQTGDPVAGVAYAGLAVIDAIGVTSIASGIIRLGSKALWSPSAFKLLVGEGSPFHVAAQLGNKIYGAMGGFFRMTWRNATLVSAGWASSQLYFRIPLGVISSKLATLRGPAWFCVSAAWNSFSRGNFHLPNLALTRLMLKSLLPSSQNKIPPAGGMPGGNAATNKSIFVDLTFATIDPVNPRWISQHIQVPLDDFLAVYDSLKLTEIFYVNGWVYDDNRWPIQPNDPSTLPALNNSIGDLGSYREKNSENLVKSYLQSRPIPD